jgi:hypothetical protein
MWVNYSNVFTCELVRVHLIIKEFRSMSLSVRILVGASIFQCIDYRKFSLAETFVAQSLSFQN